MSNDRQDERKEDPHDNSAQSFEDAYLKYKQVREQYTQLLSEHCKYNALQSLQTEMIKYRFKLNHVMQSRLRNDILESKSPDNSIDFLQGLHTRTSQDEHFDFLSITSIIYKQLLIHTKKASTQLKSQIKQTKKEQIKIEKKRIIEQKEQTKIELSKPIAESTSTSKMQIIHWQWNDKTTYTSSSCITKTIDTGKDEDYKTYSKPIVSKIEKLRIGCQMEYKASNDYVYRIVRTSHNTGYQFNLSIKSQTKRHVRRIVDTIAAEAQPHSHDNINYPCWWTALSETHGTHNSKTTNAHAHHQGSVINRRWEKPSFVVLDRSHAKFTEMSNLFYATQSSEYMIMKIESVENQRLWDSYYNEKARLIKEVGQTRLNELLLFHGTNAKTIQTLATNGFLRDYCKNANYGYGSYFAVTSRYSTGYATKDRRNVQRMLVCQVLCGESVVGHSGYKLNSWPTKPSGILYDSLVNNVVDPKIYVIHNDWRIYPLFCISFFRVRVPPKPGQVDYAITFKSAESVEGLEFHSSKDDLNCIAERYVPSAVHQVTPASLIVQVNLQWTANCRFAPIRALIAQAARDPPVTIIFRVKRVDRQRHLQHIEFVNRTHGNDFVLQHS